MFNKLSKEDIDKWLKEQKPNSVDCYYCNNCKELSYCSNTDNKCIQCRKHKQWKGLT